MKMSNSSVNTSQLFSLLAEYRRIPCNFVSEFPLTDAKSRLTLRLTDSLCFTIRESAEYNRMSVNEYIIQALFEKLAFDNRLKELEAEIDNFALLTAKRDSMPGNETLLDMDKFNESRSKYREKVNASRASKYRIMRTCS